MSDSGKRENSFRLGNNEHPWLCGLLQDLYYFSCICLMGLIINCDRDVLVIEFMRRNEVSGKDRWAGYHSTADNERC